MALELLIANLLVGVVGGYLGGIVGAGIGATVVPALILLNVDPTIAIGSSLLLHVLISPLGGFTHYKCGHIRRKIVVPLVLAGMLGAFLGANIATNLPKMELITIVGVSTVVAGFAIVIKFPRLGNQKHVLDRLINGIRGSRATPIVSSELVRCPSTPCLPPDRASPIASIGLVAGLSHGALGTGWGPMGVPLLILAGIAPQCAVASSLVARFFVALIGSSTYLALTGVHFDIVLPLLVGGSIAMIAGAFTSKRLRPETLKRVAGIAAILLGATVLVKLVIG